jgi:hypothetical protein
MNPLPVAPRAGALIALVATIPLLSLTSCSQTVTNDIARDEAAYRQAVVALADDRQASDDAAGDADLRKLSLAVKQLREDRGTQRDPNHDSDGHGGGGGHM